MSRDTTQDRRSVEMLMALYRSAEAGPAVEPPDEELETYIPPVARGEYRG